MTTRVWMFVMSTSVVEHIISQCPDSSIVVKYNHFCESSCDIADVF